jgi:uncharacterized membrane protein YfcA
MGATSPSDSHTPPPLRYQNPALHRIGWHRDSLVWLACVGLGYLIGLIGPAFVVPPGVPTAPRGKIAVAFGITVLGVAIAAVSSMLAYRRRRNWSWLVIGIVPAISLLVGGAILAATKANSF